jgi:hypothetical protein
LDPCLPDSFTCSMTFQINSTKINKSAIPHEM